MFPSAAELAAAMEATVAGRGRILVAADVVLLLPDGAGWPLRLLLTPDVVRVLTGTQSRISIAADDRDGVEHIGEVVGAILAGDAEEYFGWGDEGALSVIGHRVWYPGGSMQALDDLARVIATHRAPAWGPADGADD